MNAFRECPSVELFKTSVNKRGGVVIQSPADAPPGMIVVRFTVRASIDSLEALPGELDAFAALPNTKALERVLRALVLRSLLVVVVADPVVPETNLGERSVCTV